MGRLKDKVVIITGAASGIGKETARLAIEEGAKVTLTDIDEKNGKAVANELGKNALFIKHDVTKADEWKTVVSQTEETFGPITGLFNNAGVVGPENGGLEELSDEDFYNMVDTNLYSVFKGMQSVVESMKKAEAGSIINASSTSGLVGTKDDPSYTATKFAVRGLSKAAALELAEFNIRVNSIHPGVIDTNIELFEEVIEQTPLSRVGDADEIGYLVIYLLSDESTFSTGAEFVADGGFTA